ncbi:MAG: hypothetical protein IH802_03395 [Nitrospinae bacterium]|nr:hypothetical protein [Nitrospinota bacterium]
MNVQILNEIAALARKAPPPQVGAPVSGNAQLKALKGSPVHPPGNPAPPPFEAPPQSDQEPVTPEISSMARAASAYSAAVNHGLNLDEINAIQDLAGQIRPAIADFLNQPGLEQAHNAEAMMVAHPEAVQDLQAGLEQAVVETFSAPPLVDDGIVSPDVPHEQTPVAVASVEIPVSEERVTNGAKPNPAVPAIAASPALQNTQARQHANVDNPVTVEGPPETASGDFTAGNSNVTPASPALQNAQAQAREQINVNTPVTVEAPPEAASGDFTAGNSNVTPASPGVANNDSRSSRVEEPVAVEGGPENSKGDFTGIATSPARVIPQSIEEVRVENPVSRPATVSFPNQEVTAGRPEMVAANAQPTPAVPPETRATTQQETPVSRPETAAPQQAPQSQPETVATTQPGTPVIAASPALQNAAGGNTNVEPPVSRPETAAPQQAPQSQPETVATTQPGTPVTVASPVLQNARAGESANVETPVSRSDTPTTQPSVQSQSETVAATQRETPVTPPPTRGVRELISDSAAVNPENVRDVNALVNSVVENEFTAEAKKIFSELKVIRTVADLADFILERLREIILTKQLQKQMQSEGESGIS